MSPRATRITPTPTGPAPAERERIRRSFLAMALAHELKQPLNSLNLNAELLSKRLGRAPVAAADIAGPLQALGRVVDRVSACLEAFYTRVQPDPVPEQPSDLRPVLLAAAARAGIGARRSGVDVEADVPEAIPHLPIHQDQLAVALDELLANAIKASPRGRRVTVHAQATPDEVRISISDLGSGMTSEVARRAVEIGFSTHGGDGTGLTIAKFIAYHHSGGFQLDTRPGGGTTASMILPIGGE